jgi:arylsulfatase
LPQGFTKPPILEAVAGGEAKFVKEYNYQTRRTIDFEIADKSIKYIEDRAKEKSPFFLFASWTRPHEPNKPSKEFEGKSRIGDYGDGVMELDYNTGRVLAAIDNAGIRENTIVVWVSDNGPTRTTSWPDSGFSGPYRGELGSSLEGSIRTAGMVRWPGKIKPRVSNEMFSIMDFFPTFAKFIGASNPSDRLLDGVDQSDFLLGKQQNSNRQHLLTFAGDRLQAVRWRQFRVYFIDQGLSGTSINFQYGLGGSYKSVDYPSIFNIEHDPREEHNVSAHHAWVMSHALRYVQEYKASLKKDPNPPAPNLSRH